MTGRLIALLREFHEAPLAGFTSAAVAGAGIAAVRPLAWALGLRPDDPGKGLAATILLLICAGLLVSTLHLGRPSRMLLTLLRAGRSSLSTEVVFAAATAASALVLVLIPDGVAGRQTLWMLASFSGLGLLVSLTWVYWLPGQLAWKGVPALSVIPIGLLVGLMAHIVMSLPRSRSCVGAMLLLALLDASAWAARSLRVEASIRGGGAAYPAFIPVRRWIYVLRFLLVFIPTLAVLISGAVPALLVPMGLGIVVDRISFYGFAFRQSTEREIARVESLLAIDD